MRVSCFGSLVIASLSAFTFSSSTARAQHAPTGAPGHVEPTRGPSPLDLTWSSPDPACDGRGVTARALQLVRPGVTPRGLAAHAQLARDAAGWSVRLVLEGRDGASERLLRGDTCAELEEAVALVLAMVLESDARREAVEPEPAPPAPPTPPPPPPRARPAPPARAPTPPEPKAEPRDWWWLVRAHGSAAWGLKPGLAPGFGAAVGAIWSRWELSAGVLYWPSTSAEVLGGGANIEVIRQAGALSVCFSLLRSQPFELVPCIAPETTWFRSQYFDPVTGSRRGPSHHVFSLSAGADLRAWFFGSRMFAALTPGVTWELKQPFGVRACVGCELIPVYRTDGLGPWVRLGVGARF